MGARRRPPLRLWLVVLAGLVVVAGWETFWFQTDDAFISFRYIANHMEGFGYVWNPPPFRAVEGYTNLLWMMVLEGVWRGLGIAPPHSSTVISLVFTLGSVFLVAALVERISPEGPGRGFRGLFLGLVLLGVVTNRTMLTWASSGLETAMFNFLVLLWVFAAPGPDRGFRIPLLAGSASLAYLTRPDGILFVLGTIVIAAGPTRRLRRLPSTFAGLLPLLAVPVHVVWRRGFYGEWLPNTFHAKNVGPWPESGLRYALSFVLEYGLWFWMAVAVAGAVSALRRRARTPGSPERKNRLAIGVVAGCLVIHALYYTLVVGGDHFEYRVYSHLIPLLFVGLLAMLLRLVRSPVLVSAGLVFAILVSLPVPYTHWARSRHLTSRKDTFKMRVPVAPSWPAPVRGYAEVFDRTQAWLIDRYVCMRQQEHKINLEYIRGIFPARGQGPPIPEGSYPTFVFPAVGYAGWVLPEINILDSHGLNDYVVARTPVDPGVKRAMAHDRQPPPGYFECLAPNVELVGPKRLRVSGRAEVLTVEGIRECETVWARRVTGEGP